jgi:hypothetical protein
MEGGSLFCTYVLISDNCLVGKKSLYVQLFWPSPTDNPVEKQLQLRFCMLKEKP